MAEEPVDEAKNLVVIGVKPTMNYVVACITLFNSGMQEIIVRARGRHISKAVDVVELLRRVFVKDLRVEDIAIGTEFNKDPGGNEVSISIIEIKLKK